MVEILVKHCSLYNKVYSLVVKNNKEEERGVINFLPLKRLKAYLRGGLNRGFTVKTIILLHEKFLQFDWLRAVVFQLNLKYLHVKITNLLWVVV